MAERSKKFNPASLSKEEQEAVIEHYLGVHPKYFVYRGIDLSVDIYNLNLDRKTFNGFLPHLKQLGIE
jgi:hypothetical protein